MIIRQEGRWMTGIGHDMMTAVSAKLLFAAVFASALAVSALLPRPGLGNGDAPTIRLEFHDRALSATIENAPLREIVARIEEARNIWIKGMDRVPQVEYSVEFRDMPLYEGMERILSPANHCLVFNGKGELEGIIFLTSPGTPSKKTAADISGPEKTKPGAVSARRSRTRNQPKRR